MIRNRRHIERYANDPEFRQKKIEGQRRRKELGQLRDANWDNAKERQRLTILIQNERESHQCFFCKATGLHHSQLDHHHRDPNTKLFNVSEGPMLRKSEEEIWEEIAKCEVSCSNCHEYHTWMENQIERQRWADGLALQLL